MKTEALSIKDKKYLLKIARKSLEEELFHKSDDIQESVPESLLKVGVTFVTLRIDGELRGCVGGLIATQPLIDDVREHAKAAAFEDFRFPSLRREELAFIKIEISLLTEPIPLEYSTSDELLSLLRPRIDGVVLRYGNKRATFLPQVWETLPDPASFLCHLCQKMGVDPFLWKDRKLEVNIYQVEEFHE